ncbi:uncharacterized protein DSM5745_05534 [Aspergillus mulundensis]|uniref:Uncharacterized protein n=1 Tax=Aspergillus mulundensis TaxID=1810919 RepID=A0A3D8RX89_9EURO|nr:hypothetical protein DSM5745_05534 [Aspergillus mulundensis]RDW78682.1 hypothetical protein DSM5745_05534 [Aspergillus mulundensis]
MTNALKATSIGWLVISVGHVVRPLQLPSLFLITHVHGKNPDKNKNLRCIQLGAKEWQSSPQFRALPVTADTCARVGWYQGSAFFLVNALINYNWSLAPEQLRNPINKAAALVMALSMLGSSAGYFRGGVSRNGLVVAVVGVLQAWAALRVN